MVNSYISNPEDAYNPVPDRYKDVSKNHIQRRNRIKLRADSINGDRFIDDGLSERPLNDYETNDMDSEDFDSEDE